MEAVSLNKTSDLPEMLKTGATVESTEVSSLPNSQEGDGSSNGVKHAVAPGGAFAYTTDDTPRHVEYVLTADFDIDAGPSMTFQYPVPIQGDHYLMAELMLPDGSHTRQQDWTIFFLYQRKGHQKLEYHISDEVEKQAAKKYYVLNLVNTKYTDNVKRGAMVKSMCIITPHPFFHVFKPLLILALDEYFRNPVAEVLQSLYDALNNIDVSRMPRLSPSERQVLASSENNSLFAEKFEELMSPNNKSSQDASGQPAFYIDLKSQGYVSRIQRDTHFFDTKVDFNGMKIPLKIPMDSFEESVGDFSLIKLISTLSNITQPFSSVHRELTTYGPNTPAVLVLINALLTQKRILFYGVNSPSFDVAEHVLAACSLASGGILRTFNTHAFPYTDLSKVDDLLSSSGYIAGVKNPAFERHPGWWDIIVDLEAGTMKISSEVGTPVNSSYKSSPLNAEDAQFVEDLKHMVANHYGEASIRAQCRQYIKRFVRIATNFEESRYGSTELWPSVGDKGYLVIPGHGYTWAQDTQRLQDFEIYSPVIEGWRRTRSYQAYKEDQQRAWPKPPKHVVDYEYHLDRLRLQKLSFDESAFIFTTLCTQTRDYDDINHLLSASSGGNLFYLALGLFHRDANVRTMTAKLINRIEYHSAGSVFYKSMSQFQKLAYKRILTEIDQEVEDGQQKH